MNPPIPMQWVGLIALPTLFTVMFAIGLMLGPAQVAAAMTRRTILLAVLFAAVVPLPVVTAVAVELFNLRGPTGVGLLLMATSLGALIRYLKLGLAVKIEPRAARLGNGLVAVFTVVLLIDVVPIVASMGYVPALAGAIMAIFALAIGGLFAGRDAQARPAAATPWPCAIPGLRW